MALETLPWDPAAGLGAPEARAAYIEAAFEDGDPAVIAAALGNVAKIVGMGEVAKASGLSRQALYRGLSADGNPELKTLMRVLLAVGLELHVKPIVHANDDHAPSVTARDDANSA